MNSEMRMKQKEVNKLEISKFWKKIKLFRETNLILIITLIFIMLSILSPYFLTKNNLMSTAIGMASDGIVVVAMTIVLVSGGIDFSIGSLMSLSGVTAGALYVAGMNIWAASVVALVVGMAFGLLNGFFIGKIGLNPFITTLAVMGIARGLTYVITEGYPISIFGITKSFEFVGQGKIMGVPFLVAIFIVIAIIGDFLMRRSEPIRKVQYTGSNERVAVLSGIDTSKIKIGVYLNAAILASIAGILNMARFTVAAPVTGLGADVSMRCILAAIIGGVSLSGGEGTVLGSVLGLILINLINNGFILLNVPVYWQDLVNGIILITAVTVDYLGHQNKYKGLLVKK